MFYDFFNDQCFYFTLIWFTCLLDKHRRRRRGGGRGRAGRLLLPPPKFRENICRANVMKIRAFSGKYHVKFRNFVIFRATFIFSDKNVLPTQSWLSSYAYVDKIAQSIMKICVNTLVYILHILMLCSACILYCFVDFRRLIVTINHQQEVAYRLWNVDW